MWWERWKERHTKKAVISSEAIYKQVEALEHSAGSARIAGRGSAEKAYRPPVTVRSCPTPRCRQGPTRERKRRSPSSSSMRPGQSATRALSPHP